MFLKAMVAALLMFSTAPALAQEPSSSGQQTSTPPKSDKPDTPPQPNPKKEKPDTRTAAMSTSGDSAAGSIGGIRTPEGVKVSSGGLATLSIPIAVSPGIVKPNLSFNYSSQGENSLLGVGWSVSGLPIIHRCARTVAQDGQRGGINYDTNDRFCLDGQRLMVISGTYGGNGSEYRTEIDSFLKVTSHGSAGSGPAYFIVKTKAGETLEFGNSADSRIEAEGKSEARVWALNKIQDIKANYLTVSYLEDPANGEYRPDKIDYTGNSAAGLAPTRQVKFVYQSANRPDAYPLYVGGSKILTTKLLDKIQTYAPLPGTTSPMVLVREYRLAYEPNVAPKRSRLISITECGASGNCLPNWQATWRAIQNNFDLPVWNGNLSSDPLLNLVGDINGDGRSDLISRSGTANAIVHLSTGANFTVQTWSANLKANGVHYVMDVNGDGKDEIVAWDSPTGVKVHFINATGNNFDIQAWPGTNLYANYKYNFPGDFDGDGRIDIASRSGADTVTMHLATGTGFTVTTWSCALNTNGVNYVGDFNGDGRSDILVWNSSTSVRVCLSSGTGFTPVIWTGTDLHTADYLNTAADVNGDGLTDIVSWKTASTAKVHLSKAGGAAMDVQTWASDFNSNGFNFPGDFNGDGKQDIASWGIGGVVRMHLSKGSEFVIQTWSGNLNANGVNYVGDFNGDGLADIGAWGTGGAVQVHKQQGPFPDLITNVVNPFRGSTAITYKPLTDTSVYTKDTGAQAAVYPNVDLQHPLYVVANLTANDGLGGTYQYNYMYRGAKANYLGRGSLGYRSMQEIDFSAQKKTTTFYNQAFPHIGLPSNIETDRASDGAPFRDTIHEYWNLNAYPTTAPTVRFVAPKKVDIVEQEGSPSPNRTIRREFSYDSAATGNLTSIYHHGDFGLPGDEREERTEWIVDTTNWRHRAKTLELRNGAAGVVRRKLLYYDGLPHGQMTFGLLTKEESDGMGQVANASFIYGYEEPFGIRNYVKDPRACETTTVYDTSKTFPKDVRTCVSTPGMNFLMRYDYDPRFGVRTKETDWNGQVTIYEYDTFGRPTKVIGPLDSTATPTTIIEYVNWGTLNLTATSQHVKTSRREQHGGAGVLTSEEYFDGMGRIDRTRQEGPVSGQFILTDSTFDSRNLTTQKFVPYLVNASNNPLETPKFATFFYDPLGRLTQVTNPDATSSTNRYFVPGGVEHVDERGKKKRKYFDAYEQLIKVEEVNAGATYTTTYERDTSGALKTVKNQLDHYTRIDYDPLGRKRAMCDPNMGTASGITSCTTSSVGAWVYTYNPAGDLLTQKDAKNQTLTFTYDALGRPLTKKQGTTSLATFTYDASTISPPPPGADFPVGRLTQVVDQATTTKFAYDRMGRVLQSQRQLLGVWHTMSQSYDALSRITSETFPSPDNETVTYSYNQAGWLSSVGGYINSITYNARGQKKAITYANNVTTTLIYNDPMDRPGMPSDFRLFNRTTSNNQQNLTYGYDPVGNLLSITDSLFTASRALTYDDLNRLETASGTFGPNQSQQNCSGANRYIYNPIGNLVSKCGAVFSYGDSLHPSAVTFNPATARNYTYDANGNMLTRGTQTLAWDIDNRVTSVAILGGGTTSMQYDYSGMRVKKDSPTGITLFPFKGYEIAPDGTITKFIRIGNETFASKKRTTGGVTTQYFYHNDYLGGVNVITNITGAQAQLNEYDPWGAVSRSAGNVDQTHRFTGQELDPESGLYYYGGRYYDQEISRFISPDPYVQEPDEPQNLNRYSYTLNNPQGYVDPDGHFFWLIPAIVAVIATVVAELLPGLLVLEGTLTALGVATQITITAAQIGTFAADVVKNGELQREGTKQKRTDINQVLSKNDSQPGNPNSQNNPGNDSRTGNGSRSGRSCPGCDEVGNDNIVLAMSPLRMIPRRLWQVTPTGRGMPKPPGWTDKWQFDKSKYQTSPKKGPRWIDPKGGEWRWSSIDENPYHMDQWPEGHWDYNPRNVPNSRWQNIGPSGEYFPSMPPGTPSYPIPDLMPDPRA
ncbi:MAG: RHS repeat-associated core domain-containing protein [Candidatus Binatia bacterium]|nr:RHS repeat-associated core domain-containing protein [Candidatus Binatia bacterium]